MNVSRSRLLSLLVVVLAIGFALPALASNVTISGNVTFASLDGSALDDDHTVNGVFTVNGDLTVLGTINCNDDGAGANSACPMQFVVTGNFSMAAGSAIYAENRSKMGNGGDITFTIGGTAILHGTSGATPGALISSAKTNDGNPAHGGDITFNTGGLFTQEAGSIVSSAAKDSTAGDISVTSGGVTTIGGYFLAGPTRAVTTTVNTGVIISGGGGHSIGGAITIKALSHSEPGLVVTSSAIIASQGTDQGASTVALEGCLVKIDGLVASIAKKTTGPRVVVRSGSSIIVDSSTLAGVDGAHRGQLRSDATHEDAGTYHVDLFARNDITIIGPPTTSTLFSVTSNPGDTDKRNAGDINLISTTGTITASGNAFQVSGTRNGDKGGDVNLSAKSNVTLNGATIDASGATSDPNRAGGHINVRSYSGAISWLAGVGDVRPYGSTAGVPAAQQGTIILTYCTTLTTAGSSFPTNGTATGVFPTTAQTCSPAAPALPVGEPALPDCNDPPVANDDNYTVAEGGTLNVPAPGVLANDSDPEMQPITAILVSGPAHASSFTFNADGSFNYVHNGGETTSDSFTYKANDGSLDSNVATVHITITPVNDPPVAVNDSYTIAEGGTLNVAAPGVMANDTDPDGPTMTAILVSGPANASSFALNGDGSFSYTHNGSETTSDSFTYKVTDGSLTSNTATVSITVTPVNDAPVAVNDSYSTNEDTPLTVSAPGVLGNDSDIDSPTITAILVSGPSHAASFALNANGSFNYTPAADYNGSDSFTYKANDGSLDSNVATVNLTINAVNDAPVAVADSYATNEDTPLTVNAASGVLANDTDIDTPHSSLTAVLNSGPSNAASFALNADGSFSYTPNANFNGSDSFTYHANDGALDSNVVTVTITVSAVNDAPVVTAPATASTNEDTPLVFNSISASDADSGAGSVTLTLAATSGTLTLGSTAGLTVSGNGTSNITASGTITNVNAALNGLTYSPDANYNGSASLTVTVNDNGNTGSGGPLSDTKTVAITVVAVDDAPVAVADSYSTNEDTPLTVTAPGVLGNDSDVDSPTITAVLVSGPSNAASFALNANGSFNYTPAANFNGTDSFTYKANDGTLDSNTVTVTITVNAINDAPVITAPVSASTNEDTTLVFNSISVSDVDAGAGSVTMTLSVSNGTLTLASTAGLVVSGNGSSSISASGTTADLNNALNGLAYAPNAEYSGADALALTANDNGNSGAGGPLADAKSVSITVNAVNDAPVNSVPGPQTIAEDTSLTFSTSNGNAISVSDVDAGAGSVQVTLSATNGTIAVGSTMGVFVSGNGTSTVTITGTIVNVNASLDGTTFTPTANFSGTTSLTVTTNDQGNTGSGGAQTDTDSITINVTAVNDAPVANNDSYSTSSGVPLNVPAPGVLGNDTDVDSPTLTAILVSGPSHAASFSFNADGSFSYQSTLGFVGTDTFTYKANDGSLDSNVATVSINVINAAPVAVNDNYSAVGNTELRVGTAGTTPAVSVSGSVLDNDTDPDTPHMALVVSAFDATSANGGSVTMLPNGNFSYLPAVGFTGVDTFHYTVSDGVSTSNGLVTITVANRVWYVNNTAISGDGRSTIPFPTLAQAQTASAAGDYIYIHFGNGTSSGQNSGIVLKNNQHLIGQGVALVVGAFTLNPAGATPTIGSSGAGVTLANGDTVAGIHIASMSFGIAGSSVSGGTIDTVQISGGTDAISLSSTSGTFGISNVTLTPGGAGLVINGGTPVINASNLSVTTTGGKGILGTAGTLNISGNSTVASTNNVAVDLSGMTLGVALTSVTASGSTNGISLVNTTGSFAVNGTGTTSGSGGTISNMTLHGAFLSSATNVTLKNMNFTNAATTQTVSNLICASDLVTGNNLGCTAPVYMSNATNVSLNNVVIDGSVQNGINGNNVNGFSLVNSEVKNAGNESFESGLLFQNLSGTVTLTNANLHNNFARQMYVENLTGSMTMTATGSTFSNSAVVSGQQGLLVETQGAASATLTVGSSTFASNGGGNANALQVNGNGTSNLNVSVGTSTFQSNAAGVVVLVTAGTNATYDIHDNPVMTGNALQAIIVGQGSPSTGTVSGTITNNVIGTTGVGGSACAPSSNCNGIDLNTQGSGTLSSRITGNNIRQVGGFGIRALAVSGSASMQLKINGNTIAEPFGATPANAIFVQSGSVSTATTSVCADIVSNSISGIWDPAGSATAIRVRNRFAGTTFRLPGYAGTGNDVVMVALFLSGQNGGATASATVSGNIFAGGAACTTP